MRNRMLIVALAVVLGISGYAAIALARASQPTGDVRGLVESSPMEDDAKLFSSNVAAFGIELKDALGVPTVSEESAIAIARKDIAGMIVGDAGHITAMYTRFSDYPAGPDGAPLVLPGTSRVMKDVPVWIVTFHGVYMQHSGPCMIDASDKQIPSSRDPYVFGDTNVVLDAETGEVLEDFSYNTLEAPTIEVATTLPSWNGMSLRDTAVQWAALCGEEHPADIRFVETTRQKAAKLLHGARVDSDDACYAVVLHGKFVDTMAFTPDGRSMYGTTMTFILRSSDGAMTDFGLNDLPYADLDTLGIVKAIAP